MMHKIRDYKDPTSPYSRRLTDYIEKGSPWETSEVMQESMTLEEKGWNVKVRWGKQYAGDLCMGLGVFADEDIPNGKLIRTGTFGINIIHFNQNTNLPNHDKETVKYLQNYTIRCPCHRDAKEYHDDLVVYVPGLSSNHSADVCVDFECWENGVNMYAARDIFKGEYITMNYSILGSAPEWFTGLLNEQLGDRESVFSNDYS